MVFFARFKSILIRIGGWAGHFVLSCGLALQTLVSRIMMLNKLREMSSRGPSGHPDGASWGGWALEPATVKCSQFRLCF